MELHMPIWQRKGRFLWFQIVHAIYKDSSPTNMKNNQSQTPGACLDKKGAGLLWGRMSAISVSSQYEKYNCFFKCIQHIKGYFMIV